jgi:hypothetical protein
MRYIDTGSRDPAHAVATWLAAVLTDQVTEVRWQTGFFNDEPLGLFAQTFQRLAQAAGRVHALIGSNPPGTQHAPVAQLVQLLGLPRANVRLGVIQYRQGFYHPKTIHLRRANGSQCAYVGSANLTGPGVSSLHVEAGLTLDTADGDPIGVLNEIAAAVDAWFDDNRAGLHVVANPADVQQLLDDGVLIVPPPPEPPAPPAIAEADAEDEEEAEAGGAAAAGGGGAPRPPRLNSLVNLPPVPAPAAPIPAPAPAPAPAALPVVNQAPFPAHVLLAPGQATPTIGAQALSGRPLPGGAVGIVVRLSGDTNRIFTGQGGTANMSLPSRTIETLRFGLQGRGRYPQRPRAEYDLEVRYIGAQTFALPDPAETNVMPYGYIQGEPGNRDIRMLIPAAVRTLIPHIQGAGMPLPADGDYALVEWPTADPTFRLTFIQPNHALATQAQQLFTAAAAAQQLLGDNGCGLPAGVAPAW